VSKSPLEDLNNQSNQSSGLQSSAVLGGDRLSM
jgi:hypothetical protein